MMRFPATRPVYPCRVRGCDNMIRPTTLLCRRCWELLGGQERAALRTTTGPEYRALAREALVFAAAKLHEKRGGESALFTVPGTGAPRTMPEGER